MSPCCPARTAWAAGHLARLALFRRGRRTACPRGRLRRAAQVLVGLVGVIVPVLTRSFRIVNVMSVTSMTIGSAAEAL